MVRIHRAEFSHSLGRGRRVGRRDRSSAIWCTPDVLPTWSRRRPLTQSWTRPRARIAMQRCRW